MEKACMHVCDVPPESEANNSSDRHLGHSPVDRPGFLFVFFRETEARGQENP